MQKVHLEAGQKTLSFLAWRSDGAPHKDRRGIMRRLPPLTSIEAFVQVARLGSVKAAAESLSLSGPALSRRIQALERFIGRPLFERRHQAIHLNDDGERLLGEIGPSLETLTRAIERATGGADLMRLRLSVPLLFATQRLMPMLPDLRRRHPDLHIDLDTGAHGLARLDEGLDAAIAIVTDVDPYLYARRIDSNRVIAIGSRALANGPRAITHPSQLASATIFLHRDLPDLFDRWREAVGLPDLEPAAIDHFDSGPLILDAAARGLGIAFMLEGHLKESQDDRLVQLFDLRVESPYGYWFACRHSALRRRPVRLFHDWLFERLQVPVPPQGSDR